jgi:hypothetical protein
VPNDRQRIHGMSYDILSQVVDEIISCSNGLFSIQLESTDVANLAQLLVYIRYADSDNIKTEFLFFYTFGNYDNCKRYF